MTAIVSIINLIRLYISNQEDIKNEEDREEIITKYINRQIKNKLYEDAISGLDAIEKEFDKTPLTNYLRSFTYFKSGDFEKALNNVNNDFAVNPSDPKLVLLKAKIECSLKKYDTALTLIESLLISDPKEIEYLILRCKIEAESRKVDEANRTIKEILNLDNDNEEAHFYRALIQLFEENNPDPALQQLLEIIEKTENESLALSAIQYMLHYFELCGLNFQTEEVKGALDDLEKKAMELNSIVYIECKYCKTELKYKEEDLIEGTYVRCKNCNNRIVLNQ